MADYRNIQTRTWSDSWFSDLSSDAKLLFIYLITNEHATVTGLYEIPVKTIAFETGLDAALIPAMLVAFESAEKAYYRENWVFVVNMQRYQASTSPKIAARIAADMRKTPEGLLKKMYLARYGDTVSGFQKKLDRVSIPYGGFSENAAEQNRAEQSRTEQNRSEQNKAAAAAELDEQFGIAMKAYEKNIGPLTPLLAEAIRDAVPEFTAAWIVDAISEAVQNSGRSWKYVMAILNRWKNDGYRSPKPNGNGNHPVRKDAFSAALEKAGA
jgi:DnaD/phage-associated family protein